MAVAEIGRRDLDPVLVTHRGHEALTAALEQAAEPAALLSVLGRFIQFNSAFGAGVANLAGEIAARQDLFRDPAEPVWFLADRASDVAANFLHAAIDEFDDRATPWRDPHRTLAGATLKGMSGHFGFRPEQLNDVIRMNRATDVAIQRVRHGYGVGARLDERRLFQAMGFHVGSEILADQEFTIIDQVLRARQPELVRALEAKTVAIAGERHNAYYWIRIHTSVEADHFDAALKGVNEALRYYAGSAGASVAKQTILEGFARFATIQAEFMAGLGEP